MKGLKTLGCLLALLIAAVILFPASAKAAEVEINEENFPDKGFREFVQAEFDKDGDWELSEYELQNARECFYDDSGCTDLTGVELLTNLEVLSCGDNNLTSLDVSKLTKLEDLDCRGNALKKLDVTKNKKLQFLWCSNNQLTTLKLSSNNKYLLFLDCSGNKLKTLDVSVVPDLFGLECRNNLLTTLDLSANAELGRLSCEGNSIGKLDIRPCKKLVMTYTRSSYWGGSVETKNGVTCYTYENEDDMSWDGGDGEFYELYIDKTTVLLCRPKISSPKEVTKKTVSTGDKVSLKVTAKSGFDMTYQWFYKKPGASSYTKVTAASGKKATYTFTAADKHNGYQYLCKVTNKYGSTNSKVFKLTVKPLPKITSPTKATTKTVKKGKSVTFSVTATGAEKYQWEYRTSKTGAWKTVAAASGKTANYKLAKALAKHNGYQYRCKVFNEAGGYVYSKIFTLKVK